MTKAAKTLEFKFERTIPAPPGEVFDAWLNPKIAGNPWNLADKFLLNPKVDGLFFWALKEHAHYGRFTDIERPRQMRHTWMSSSTLGQESTVTLTFKKKGKGTLMTLLHTGLPDHEVAKGHEKGWNYFLSAFTEQFENGARKAK
jgi:uncharacterized protein YndB with AHSA1/START domain